MTMHLGLKNSAGLVPALVPALVPVPALALTLALTLALGALPSIAFAAASSSSPSDTSAPAAETAAVTPTDGQIESLMIAANQAEIEEAKMAQSKAQSKAVKDFASHMMTEHSKNEKEGKALAKKEGVKLDTNFAPLDEMKKDAAMKSAELKKVKGLEFDKTYMANQIAMHEGLLSKLNEQFIPSAKNRAFKDYLENTKSHVQAHLDLAKSVQSKITAQ